MFNKEKTVWSAKKGVIRENGKKVATYSTYEELRNYLKGGK